MPLPVIPRHKKTVPKSANRHQQYHFYKSAFASCIIIAVKEIWSKRSHRKDFHLYTSVLPAMWSTAMRTCCLFSQCKVWLRNKFSAMLSKIKKCCSRKLLQCFWGGINLPVRNKLKKKQAYPLIRIYVLGIMLIPIYDISFSLDNKTSLWITILFYKSQRLDPKPFRTCKALFILFACGPWSGSTSSWCQKYHIQRNKQLCLTLWLFKMFYPLLFLNVDADKALTSGQCLLCVHTCRVTRKNVWYPQS